MMGAMVSVNVTLSAAATRAAVAVSSPIKLLRMLHYRVLARYVSKAHPSPLSPPILVSSMIAGILCRPVNAMTEIRPMTETINVNINGTTYSHDVEPRLLLIHYLREVVGLTGPHIGCETSLCGACTVMLNGRTVKSCTMLAV